MKSIKNFMQEYLRVDFDYRVGVWCEKDDKLFRHKKQELLKFYTNDITPVNDRPVPISENWFELCNDQRNLFCQKEIFEIRKYEHKDLGILFYCYLNEGKTYCKNMLNTILVVKQFESGMKIISRYFLSIFDDVEEGIELFKLDNMELEHGGGALIADLGILVDRKIYSNYQMP